MGSSASPHEISSGIDLEAVARDVPISQPTGLAFFCSNVGKALHACRDEAQAALRAANGEPPNHRAALDTDPVGWGKAERKEIDNHLLNTGDLRQ